jgi:hypothetical protein
VFAEQFVIDARLVVKAFQKTSGNQFDEIAVALQIFAQEDKVISAASTGLKIVSLVGGLAGFFPAVVAAALGDVNFATDDGLDVALAAAKRLPWSVIATAGIFWREASSSSWEVSQAPSRRL